ncbi:hypothetical protein FXF53_27400 [Micromonospora sp. WP24]|uniref:hypothetical protein n=1 Tax=Micromonospora sp. WP24 TaxID=2604469 RepID=UPI0011D7931E|nr:hypothetical protein [Micromonospora sp. WP24]TYB94053.1 hypothetical protein FXF53_27400 [Micromonospora sp. WP24]
MKSEVIAALVASGLTASASIGVVAVQAWLARIREDRAALQRSYVALLALSLRLAQKAEVLRRQKHFRSGLREASNLLWGSQKPLDLMELHDWLTADMAALEAAWAEVWVSGDAEGIRLSNDVVDGFSNVMEAAMQTSGKRDMQDEDDLMQALRQFAEARRLLALHVRRVMKARPREVELFTDASAAVQQGAG